MRENIDTVVLFSYSPGGSTILGRSLSDLVASGSSFFYSKHSVFSILSPTFVMSTLGPCTTLNWDIGI